MTLTSSTRPALTLFAATAALAALAAGPPAALADEWKVVREGAKSITTIKASFVQKRALKILARPLVSLGSFCFRAPSSVRWEYASPVRTITMVHKAKARRFVLGKEGRFVPDTASGIEAMRAITEQFSTWLSGQFEQNKMFRARLEQGPPLRVILVPKEAAMARYIQRVELEFSKRPGVLRTVTLIEGPRSTTVIEFKDVVLGAPLPARLFEEVE